VRLDILKEGMREQLVPATDFDEISGRIVVLVRTMDRYLHVDYGFVADMP
jgi:hypothetical protein